MATHPDPRPPFDDPHATPEPMPGKPVAPTAPKRRFGLSPLNQRRWRNFKKNRRAYWSLWVFAILFGLSLMAEFIANDKPILVNYRGDYRMPVFTFFAETDFGGDFRTEAAYRDPEVRCLIRTGGLDACFDDPEGLMQQVDQGMVLDGDFEKGWMLWPPIPYSYTTPVDRPGAAPLPPNGQNWLGTDDTKRDVLARVIYGFRLSIMFTLIVTVAASLIGIIAGAVQGYFGGWLDLIFQRIIEIWTATPSLYVIIILFAILGRSFWLLVFLTVLFGWVALVGVVRAEFLRARNLEYVRAAKALGVSQLEDHVPPHAAQRHGRHGHAAALHRDRHDLHPGRAGLSRLRPAVLRTQPGGADFAGQTEPAGALAGLYRLFRLRDHAFAARVHLRGRARRLRPQKDLLVSAPAKTAMILSVRESLGTGGAMYGAKASFSLSRAAGGRA